MLFNIAKKVNLGNLIRTANAMGVSEVLIVGKRRFHEFGAFGTARTTLKRHFYRLGDAVTFLRERGCVIIGVEIVDDATPVESATFEGPTAFMVGNEGDGLNDLQCQACDRFVYIPQYGSCASLNVNVATGIVLHQFATKAGYIQRQRSGGKFVMPNVAECDNVMSTEQNDPPERD